MIELTDWLTYVTPSRVGKKDHGTTYPNPQDRTLISDILRPFIPLVADSLRGGSNERGTIISPRPQTMNARSTSVTRFLCGSLDKFHPSKEYCAKKLIAMNPFFMDIMRHSTSNGVRSPFATSELQVTRLVRAGNVVIKPHCILRLVINLYSLLIIRQVRISLQLSRERDGRNPLLRLPISFPTKTTSQLHVFGHDCNSFAMNSANVGIFN